MHKKIIIIIAGFLCACASDTTQNAQIEDGELPALRIAERLSHEGNYVSALKFYEKALQNEPDNTEIRIAYARTLRHNNNLGDARRVLLDLANSGHTSSESKRELARVYLQENNPREALNTLSQQLAENKDSDTAFLEAVAYDLQANHTKAQELYREILAKTPHNMRVQSNLGLSLAISGMSQEAIAILEEVHKSQSATLRDRHNLAIAYEKAGQPDKAQALWKLDLTAQEADETRQFFDSINGESHDAVAFDQATSAGPVQVTALDAPATPPNNPNSNLANFHEIPAKIPAPKKNAQLKAPKPQKPIEKAEVIPETNPDNTPEITEAVPGVDSPVDGELEEDLGSASPLS